jgi:predicted ATPase
MLIEFRVDNHRSVRDEQALTMQAGRIGGASDPRPRRIKGYSEPLLMAAALYGANASGKSNVLGALGFMREAVLASHRAWSPEEGVPRQPFAWGSKASEPSLFEVTILMHGVRYQYGFVANDERFIEEWLYAWPYGRKQTWFVRDGDVYRFGENLSGENKVVEQVTRQNALFLSTAVQHRHEQLAPLYRWFRALNMVNISGGRSRIFGGPPDRWRLRNLEAWLLRDRQMSLFDEDTSSNNDRISDFLQLLQAADVGIVGLKFEQDGNVPGEFRGMDIPSRPRILLQHCASSDDAWLPLEEESQGTLTLFRIGPVLLDTLRQGGVLIVDELEASLHPLLALEIVRQFNDPVRNPRNAQLLFTTHDTNLLSTVTGDAPLRRDQIWLTEKDREGATCLYPLTDYKPRDTENLERGYLQGRYGAIPFLGELARVTTD